MCAEISEISKMKFHISHQKKQKISLTILGHLDPLLGNDHKIRKNATAVSE
jgi:hypothetical protein